MGDSTDRRAFALRVRPDVLAAVERLAAAELRSTNAQIEILLREALAKRGLLRAASSDPAVTGRRR
jgi:hypothetical protein